jgi:Tfp pilus assembly protein PilV
MKNSLKKQRGIGLIETVVTLLIIAGSTIALLRFQNYLAFNNMATQQQSDAIQLAINKIEALRDFSVITGANSYQALASGTSTATGVNTTYTLTWTITPTTTPSYTIIDVTVTWSDRYGQSHSIEETSQVAGIDPSFSIVVM